MKRIFESDSEEEDEGCFVSDPGSVGQVPKLGDIFLGGLVSLFQGSKLRLSDGLCGCIGEFCLEGGGKILPGSSGPFEKKVGLFFSEGGNGFPFQER